VKEIILGPIYICTVSCGNFETNDETRWFAATVRVRALNEQKAIEKAKQVIERSFYKVVLMEEI